MKQKSYGWIALFLGTLALTLPVSSQHQRNNQQVVQISTISALQEGIYDGETTIQQIKKLGDFGLGTFRGKRMRD